jgi:predicted alpha/beta-hydrolase family hydrolase
MRHAFLESVARRLVARGAATLRYQFPYMEAGKSRVDSPDVAVATVRAAVVAAAAALPGIPVVAGGKSFGGRMTSEAQAREPLPNVRGLAFLGFPLHPPGNPGTSRAEHLQRVQVPMLFLQGTRDEFAGLDLLQPLVESLGGRARLVLTEGGDHSFKVPKSKGTADEVMDRLCDTLVAWAGRVIA